MAQQREMGKMIALLEPATETNNEKQETKMARGRKVKSGAPLTRVERLEKLQARIVGLTEELISGGFCCVLKPPGPIQVGEPACLGPKTKGSIRKTKEPAGGFLVRCVGKDKFIHRAPV